VALNEEQEGPYDIRTIQLFINEKKLTEETLVWKKGLNDWVEAKELLQKYFDATPPPVPKI